jgi:hypothetical protein
LTAPDFGEIDIGTVADKYSAAVGRNLECTIPGDLGVTQDFENRIQLLSDHSQRQSMPTTRTELPDAATQSSLFPKWDLQSIRHNGPLASEKSPVESSTSDES